jgi:hypothetical protein
MRERYELALKILCAVLAAFLLVQVGRVVFRPNPLKALKIPALPSLAAADSATNSASASTSAKGKTNSSGAALASKSTNSMAALATGKGASNSITPPITATGGTNSTADHSVGETNTHNGKETKMPAVAADAPAKTSTNGVLPGQTGSNSVAAADSGKAGTNSPTGTNTSARSKGPASRPDTAMMMGGCPGRPGGKKGPDLAPAVQARVDKIVESELLGPVNHPIPMGLLGIAGNVAFLRSPSGQTGLVKEGDELGGLKLLRIGTNRVLVEQSGEKKELMIFSGYGGETLMPKEKEKTNEPTSKQP